MSFVDHREIRDGVPDAREERLALRPGRNPGDLAAHLAATAALRLRPLCPSPVVVGLLAQEPNDMRDEVRLVSHEAGQGTPGTSIGVGDFPKLAVDLAKHVPQHPGDALRQVLCAPKIKSVPADALKRGPVVVVAEEIENLQVLGPDVLADDPGPPRVAAAIHV